MSTLLTLGGAFFCTGWAFGIVVANYEAPEHDAGGPTPLAGDING
jgi:hypothetical protein